jgi:hypothetical protein
MTTPTPKQQIEEAAKERAAIRPLWNESAAAFVMEIDMRREQDFIEGALLGARLAFEAARETIETCDQHGGYSSNHHRHNKYETADDFIEELK